MSTAVWYSINDSQERFYLTLAGNVELQRPFEQGLVAEECAHDFYHNRRHGFPDELPWPILVNLYHSETVPRFAAWHVDMEVEPRFYSTVKEER